MHLILIAIATLLITAAAQAEEKITYTTHIKPLFDAKCSACHGADAPEYPAFKADKKRFDSLQKGPRMDTYSHLIYYIGWPDTGALMRRLDDGTSAKSGKPGNMYQHLGSSEDERRANLSLFRSWVGSWNLKRWAEVTKDDLNSLSIPY